MFFLFFPSDINSIREMEQEVKRKLEDRKELFMVALRNNAKRIADYRERMRHSGMFAKNRYRLELNKEDYAYERVTKFVRRHGCVVYWLKNWIFNCFRCKDIILRDFSSKMKLTPEESFRKIERIFKNETQLRIEATQWYSHECDGKGSRTTNNLIISPRIYDSRIHPFKFEWSEGIITLYV